MDSGNDKFPETEEEAPNLDTRTEAVLGGLPSYGSWQDNPIASVHATRKNTVLEFPTMVSVAITALTGAESWVTSRQIRAIDYFVPADIKSILVTIPSTLSPDITRTAGTKLKSE